MLVKKVVPISSPEQTQTVPVSRVTLAYTLHTGDDVVVGPAVSISSLHLTFGNVLETKRSAELCRLTGRVQIREETVPFEACKRAWSYK